jgi:hypothetical protein
LFGANKQGIISSDVHFLSLNGAATTWLSQFRLDVAGNIGTSLGVKEIIGITVGSVICVRCITKREKKIRSFFFFTQHYFMY